MKKKALFIIPALIAIVIGAALAMRGGREEKRTTQNRPAMRPSAAQQPPASSHSQVETEGRVPAHFKTPPSAGTLPPTLAP